jgi:uncharacterized protein (TIGR03067 family)
MVHRLPHQEYNDLLDSQIAIHKRWPGHLAHRSLVVQRCREVYGVPAKQLLASDGGEDGESDPFDGSWTVSEFQGQPVGPEEESRWTFTGMSATVEFEARDSYGGTFSFDASASPKEVDFLFDDIPPTLGIYELRGDGSMVLKLDDTGAGIRPTDFTVEDEDFDHLVFVRKI